MKRKIRILHITQATGGGVERYIQMLLKYLDHELYENDLLISLESDVSAYEGMAERIEQVDMRREIGLHDIYAITKVRKVIKELQPDIIYAHSSKAGAIVRLANLGLRKPCIYNAHGWAFNMRGSQKKQVVYTLAERMLSPLCDKIVCISESEKKTALEKGICKESRIQVIMNGIDIPEYDRYQATMPDRTACNLPADAFLIGMVGRVCQQKAPDVFVQAAEIIKKRIPNAFFVIVGNGELENGVWQFAVEHGLTDSLLITGWVENPMEYIRCFDVAVLLSRWEGFGLAIAEYMLAEKPVVATKVDAIPELIQQEENGLLVEPDDPVAAANAVCRIHDDIYLRNRLTRFSSNLAKEKYNIYRVAKEHEKLFYDCLQGNL